MTYRLVEQLPGAGAEAALANSRWMKVYSLHRAAGGLMAFPNRETRRNGLQRLSQVKQRDEMLCKDFSK